jgi:hypothetical protein
MEYNIIGDIAGQFDALQALLKIMPKSATPLSVGDMVDRGPDSKGVLDFFQESGLAVLGNHEHMMIDSYRKGHYYDHHIWYMNGGTSTVQSFGAKGTADIPESYIKYLESLPLYLELEPGNEGEVGFVSHAPLNKHYTLDEATDLGSNTRFNGNSILWNRGNVAARPGMYQISGHNSQWGLARFGDPEFGICLDASASKVLTGMHWPSREIFQVPFKEK